MKTLIVHNHYQQTGGEQVALDVQTALLREGGHDVTLYTRDNAEIERYGLWRKGLFFPSTVFSWRTYREVRALLASERHDVAHVHNVFPLISPAVYRALHDAGVPIVQTIHNFRFLCPNALFYTQGRICERCKYGQTLHAVRWKCYRQSSILSALYALSIGLHRRIGTFALIDRFVALTEFTAQKLLERGLAPRHKIVVLGNALPNPLPRPGSFETRAPFVVYLGRLSPEKGVTTLIEAIAAVQGLGLKILGDGPQAQELRALAECAGLHQVEFLNHVGGDEKWNILRQALALVVPSVWYEHFPFTVLESLTVGTPVVASDLGSLPYIVEDGRTGLLFRPGDNQDLQRKLTWLMAHPYEALAMGRIGWQTVKERWSAATHYESLLRIYQDVSAKAS